MYRLEFTDPARKQLGKLPRNLVTTIRAKLEALAENPYAKNNNATKLQGREGYRLRVGDWRIMYEIKNMRLVVMVLDIKPRGGAYKH